MNPSKLTTPIQPKAAASEPAPHHNQWTLHKSGAKITILEPSGIFPRTVAIVPSSERAESNARLIAAAPELLEALQELSNYVKNEFTSSHPLCECAARALSVIAKAKGAK